MSHALVRTRRLITHRIARRIASRWSELRRSAEAGMSTAEYAVGTLAACTFAAVLVAVVKSSAVSAALTKLITSALAVGN